MTTSKYLSSYAEKHLDLVTTFVDSACQETFRQAVVIPCFDEGDKFIERLSQLPCQDPCLIILILNAPDTASIQARSNTLATVRALIDKLNLIQQDPNAGLSLHQDQKKFFLCLNLINTQLTEWHQQGVGFARKLGMDVCLQLYTRQRLKSGFVRNTDADVSWPRDYLNHHFDNDSDIAVYLYPFIHDLRKTHSPQHKTYAQLYDRWLRYYVAGLAWSKSPWAFHTVGSTMVINLHHYAINRGFPKKDAGEDFYLLNKLAKTGKVITLAYPQLSLSARLSNRTPFGTGASIAKLMEGTKEDWLFYHPEVFSQLKHWQQLIHSSDPFLELDFPPQYKPIRDALEHFKIPKLLRHCKQHSKTRAGFQRHLQNGFDANITRRTLHWLRDHNFPSVPYNDLQGLAADYPIEWLMTYDQ